MSDRWPTVTRERPCPKCGHVNRCTLTADGLAGVCWRSGSGKAWHDRPSGNGNGRASSPRPAPSRSGGQVYPTAEDAIAGAGAMIDGAKLAGTWCYHAADGAEVMKIARFDVDGGKEFRPVHRAGDGWRIGDPKGALPLYRLPLLPAEGPIFVCEGEKAAEAAAALGLTATTSAHGSAAAEKTDWRPLAGRDVVIMPDADEPGAKYAQAVARLLLKLEPPARVKIIELPGLPPGTDVVEFIAAGGTRQQIEALTDALPWIDASEIIGGPLLTCLADVQEQQVEWLWKDRIALGKLTLIAGDPDLGKSTVTLDVAAKVSTGSPFPDGAPCECGSVILISAEDDLADTVKPRLDRAGADMTKIVALEGWTWRDDEGKLRTRPFTLADIHTLEAALKRTPDCRLIIIDPVSAYLADADSHKNAEIRGLLAPLAKMAADYRVAVVLITHLSKTGGGKALYRAMGSLAFAAAARAVWLCCTAPEDRDGRAVKAIFGKRKQADARRLFLRVKNNLSAETSGLAYRIIGDRGVGRVVWDREPVEVSADEVLAQEQDGGDGRGRPSDQCDEAVEWLQAELADLAEHPVAALREAAQSAGIAWRTLQKASKALRVIYQRSNFGGAYVWRLPMRLADNARPLCARTPTEPNSGAQGAQGEIPTKTADLSAPDSLVRPNYELGTQGDSDTPDPDEPASGEEEQAALDAQDEAALIAAVQERERGEV